jgi:hypothetical protein
MGEGGEGAVETVEDRKGMGDDVDGWISRNLISVISSRSGSTEEPISPSPLSILSDSSLTNVPMSSMMSSLFPTSSSPAILRSAPSTPYAS